MFNFVLIKAEEKKEISDKVIDALCENNGNYFIVMAKSDFVINSEVDVEEKIIEIINKII